MGNRRAPPTSPPPHCISEGWAASLSHASWRRGRAAFYVLCLFGGEEWLLSLVFWLASFHDHTLHLSVPDVFQSSKALCTWKNLISPIKELFSKVEDYFLGPDYFEKFQRAKVPFHRKYKGFCRILQRDQLSAWALSLWYQLVTLHREVSVSSLLSAYSGCCEK